MPANFSRKRVYQRISIFMNIIFNRRLRSDHQPLTNRTGQIWRIGGGDPFYIDARDQGVERE